MEEKFGIKTKMYMFDELKEACTTLPNFIITNYKGLGSQEIGELRKELCRSSSKYLVVKNSIVKRVFDQLGLKEIGQFIQGEVGIGFVGDAPKASKTLVNFSKDHSCFKLNCAFIDGKIENASRIKELAFLPPKEVLIGLALSYMKSPITGFVGALKGLLRNLVYVINGIKNKRNDK